MGYISGLTVTEGFYRAGDARGKCRSLALALLLWHRCLPQRGSATRFVVAAWSPALHWEQEGRQQWRVSSGHIRQARRQGWEKVFGTCNKQPRGGRTAGSVSKV